MTAAHVCLKKLNKKGQGIVEYALLLAFIVGLAMMLNGANLSGAVKGVFDDVASLLSGESSVAWGKMDRSGYNSGNAAARLTADQTALQNLATFFIGKSYSEMVALLNGKDHGYKTQYKKDENGDYVLNEKGNKITEYVLDENGNPIPILNDGTNFVNNALGWVVQTSDGMHFITHELSSSADDTYTFTNGTKAYTKNYNDQVLSWLQGDYSGTGSYDPSNRSLVSDYAVNQYDRLAAGTLSYANNGPAVGGNGVKLRVEYDKPDKNDTSTWTVKSAKVVIDPGSQSKDNGAGISSGLEVMVKKDSSGNLETKLTTGYNGTFK